MRGKVKRAEGRKSKGEEKKESVRKEVRERAMKIEER